MSERTWYTAEELAERLDVSRRTIYRRHDRGDIYKKTSGERPMYTTDPPDGHDGRIYIISAEESDFYKIGYTTQHPYKRKNELQTGCPWTLSIEMTLRGTQEMEQRVHEHLEDHHFRGEWFEFPDAPPLDTIVNLFY